ncbi:MAG: copper resistance system multicopper oxidase [Moraxellaceae bacterium]
MSASSVSRRQFLAASSTSLLGATLTHSALAAVGSHNSQTAQPTPAPVLTGNHFTLHIRQHPINISGQPRMAVLVNDSFPAPTLHMREGERVHIEVINHLDEMTAIHWHGLLLPYQMDGVPMLSFDGIVPHSSFTYEFELQQSGTYWYHAHAGFQEQLGLYGAIVIEPKQPRTNLPDPPQAAAQIAPQEQIVMLSDWTDIKPAQLLAKLKKESHFDNQNPPTVAQFVQDISALGLRQAWQKRQMWQQMRMSPTDLADLTAGSFVYLCNGQTSATPWQAQVIPNQPLKIRLINASAQTIFDVRIPELPMTVIAADGQDVHPVTVDELRIAPAETYDLFITPTQVAYTIFAQNIDRSGYVHAYLNQEAGLTAPVPTLDRPEWLAMHDMMGNMSHAQHGQTVPAQPIEHANHQHHRPLEHSQHAQHKHQTSRNPMVDMRVDQPRRNLNDAGVNLRHQAQTGRRVLTYADLRTVGGSEDPRSPSRTITLRLTGNMQRYVWGFDGVSYADAQPILLKVGERVRFVLINDTMMTHPMHLHGMWSEVRSADGDFQVRKHTIMVQPAQQVSFDVTGIVGRWAFHCHLLYHMESGMFREVRVV